ncbi:hypothetical protein KK083_03830 [Fulvivirgaceae bacterium PWU4]|uniref:Uncharacterized protein n=1 Tax=Chryseosolibacter histidini TaxID=2782349 RepID=A0AAP2GN03_9BACT|nr:hypothetical protein [Chryseosolibacter histidini]MBT1695992.1 hypothetical protein [Chryseosolibacter histidini]
MNAYAVKMRHIMPVFLYVTIGSLIGLCMIRYIFAIQTEVLDFKQEVWEIWIPIVFPWIPITIWLRPRFRILIFRKESDRKQFLFQMLTWITMAASMVISQMYLTTASGTLQDASYIEELDSMDRSRYYRIRSFETLTSYGSYDADIHASGKHNEYLNFHLYFVCPIVRDTVRPPEEFKYWYGVSFKKQISNRLSADEKELEYNSFTKECIQKMNAFQFHDVSYFERLPNNEDRDGYLGAVANITKREDNNVVILEPKQGSFENRNGNKLTWIFGSYLIGTTVILLLLLWPRLSKVELERQWRGKKPQKDEVVDMLKFLIPKHPHFVTSVILDLNILVFIVMILAGVHIIFPERLRAFGMGCQPENRNNRR